MENPTPQPTPTPTPTPSNPPQVLTLEQAIQQAQAIKQQPAPTPNNEPTPTLSTGSSGTADADVEKKFADAVKLNEQHALEIQTLNAQNRTLMEENNKLYRQVVSLLSGRPQSPQATPQPQPTGGVVPPNQGNVNKQAEFIKKLKGGY